MSELLVDCPVCGKKVNFKKAEYRPFCCEKCQLIDLGHWFSESYSIASNSPLSEEDISQIEQHIEGRDEENE